MRTSVSSAVRRLKKNLDEINDIYKTERGFKDYILVKELPYYEGEDIPEDVCLYCGCEKFKG